MNDEPLIHWGIPGMKWGVRRRAGTARMDKSGNVTISRRGKRVPLMTTVRGKKVQVNGRALSNKTREATKKFISKIDKQKIKEFLKEVSLEMIDMSLKFTLVFGTTVAANLFTDKIRKANS